MQLRSGPAKERSSTPRPQRLTLHKQRAAWFAARVTWPVREAPIERLQAEVERVRGELAAVAPAANWTLAGPTNIGGRCTALICDPANADRIWIGAAGGGVWSSSDAGQSWTIAWTPDGPLQIGSLAIDPSNSSTLYCGTGEANLSADSYPGDGLYKSNDSGATWSVWASSASSGLPRRIGTIAVDPFDPQHVMVGGVGYGRVSQDNDFGGLYVTSDGGATWKRETFVSETNYWCHKIVFDPATQGRVFATVTDRGMASGIYRSNDGGSTWTQLKSGLPSPDRIGRTSLALAPSNPKVVYAICADAAGQSDAVLGVFKSINSGNSWTDVSRGHFTNEGQMSYGSTIAVHPLDPNRVICGGVDLHRTDDGGSTWRVASHWDADRGGPDYAHADHHVLVMPLAPAGRIYSANDGGVDISEDSGQSWSNRSAGLAITMYYDVDVAQTDIRVFGGGAQDNGTLITSTGKQDDAFELLGGDGGWMVIDPRESGHIYASYQKGGMYRFRNGTNRKVSPPFSDDEKRAIWMVYITIDPNDSATIFTGSTRVYRTRNDGVSWQALTPVLDGSAISAIDVARADSKHVYVATENGAFFRSLDGGSTWSANLAGGPMPGTMITRIETHPDNAADVTITVANFGSRHVFRSADAGSTWKDIDGGQLPDVPHHAVLVRPDKPSEMWVANDAGVYVTTDGGTSWQNATGNLPPSMVVDLVYHSASKTLLAATYGRSIWRLQLS
ncbi:WD40/YVTN/BNR-like repeat-containing protein [Roseateles sp. P5_D6]